MSTAMILYEGGLEFHTTDGEPRIRDLDLAGQLGYERPRDIRKLIGRFANEIELCATVARIGGRPAGEYWLTEAQALFIVAKSETPTATQILKLVIAAFIAVRKQLAYDEQARKTFPLRLVEVFLLPKPATEWERMFQTSLVRALCDLYRKKWQGGSHPRWLARPNGKIYDLLCSAAIGAEMRRRNPLPERGRNQHQQFTPEARDYFAAQLKIVEAIARQSENKADFWHRMDREYSAGMLQLSLGGSEAKVAVQ